MLKRQLFMASIKVGVRVEIVKVGLAGRISLTNKEADQITLRNVLGGNDEWYPQIIGTVK